MRIRLWPTTFKVRRLILVVSKVQYLRALFSGEGETEESWPVEETHSDDEGKEKTSNFAPRGASRFQKRVRNKLPKPLDLRNTRHGEVVEKVYSACSV